MNYITVMSMMKTSSQGLNLIKHHEGFRSKAYKDVAGKWTIGYGHLILPHELELITTELTHEQATDILRIDVRDAERSVQRLIRVGLEQHEFDALVSFTFNLGGGALQASTLRRLLNENDRVGAAAQFLRWVYAGGKKWKGLVRRREDERDLFLGNSTYLINIKDNTQ